MSSLVRLRAPPCASVRLLLELRNADGLDLLGDVELVLRNHVEHLQVDEPEMFLDDRLQVVEQLLALAVLKELLIPGEQTVMEVVPHAEVEHIELRCLGGLLVDGEMVLDRGQDVLVVASSWGPAWAAVCRDVAFIVVPVPRSSVLLLLAQAVGVYMFRRLRRLHEAGASDRSSTARTHACTRARRARACVI
jgi:hypothetical protein